MRVKCDYCGSIFQKLPEEGVCPNCGAAFEENIIPYPTPPVGIHKSGRCSIEITENSVIIRERVAMLAQTYEIVIPFSEIMLVKFRPAGSIFPGNLHLHNLESMHKFITQRSSNESVNDHLWINFPNYRNEEFELIYDFLNACAEINQRNKNQ